MKNLKVKSILFSLMAVLMVSIFMTSCEQETLIDDAIEETSPELGVDGFQNMIFSGTEIPVTMGATNTTVALNGALSVTSGGDVSGTISTVSEDGTVDGTVTFSNGIMVYEAENNTVELDILSTTEDLTVTENNETKKASSFEAIDKLLESTYERSDLSIELQATIAYIAILNSEAFIANMQYAQSSDNINLRGCSWWQRSAIWTVAGIISGGVGVGCAAALPPCLAGSMAFPPLSVPCYVGEGACIAAIGGSFAGAQAFLENYFCGASCSAPAWVSASGATVGSFYLDWDTSSADYYKLRYWNGSSWTHFANSNGPQRVNFNSAGHWCFAVSTVCNGVEVSGAPYSCVNIPY